MKSTTSAENATLGISANETTNSVSSEIIKREQCEIFTIVTTEKGSAITMGRYMLSPWQKYDNCVSDIQFRGWELIFAVISMIVREKGGENEA